MSPPCCLRKLAHIETMQFCTPRPVMHNPFSTAARAYLKDMAMLAAELGFTPSARARLGAFETAAGHADDPGIAG